MYVYVHKRALPFCVGYTLYLLQYSVMLIANKKGQKHIPTVNDCALGISAI